MKKLSILLFCYMVISYNCVSQDDFTPEKLRQYIEEKQLKHPEIVYAQAVIETGNFTSKIFRQNNNLFGMKYIYACKDCKVRKGGSRKTTAVGVRYNHARYKHWKHSVDDYLLWQSMWKKTPIHTENQYFTLLRKYYAEDAYYIKKLKLIINKTRQQYGSTLPKTGILYARYRYSPGSTLDYFLHPNKNWQNSGNRLDACLYC